MANQVKFDYALAKNIISEDEVNAMKKIVDDAKDVLVGKSGAGNDFLGWIDLPVDYDKEEFTRIQAAAKKIQSCGFPLTACQRKSARRRKFTIAETI